jgi:hypothetical protein
MLDVPFRSQHESNTTPSPEKINTPMTRTRRRYPVHGSTTATITMQAQRPSKDAGELG